MMTEPSGYSIFPGDITCYTLKCFKCGQSVSPHGSIREILMHAPLVTIHHWDMIQPKDWDMIEPKDGIPYSHGFKEQLMCTNVTV